MVVFVLFVCMRERERERINMKKGSIFWFLGRGRW